MTESAFKDLIMKTLRAAGIPSRRVSVLYGNSGWPDIDGVLPGGRALYIEAKKPGKYANPYSGLTRLQAHKCTELTNAGAVVLVIDDLKPLRALLSCVCEKVGDELAE